MPLAAPPTPLAGDLVITRTTNSPSEWVLGLHNREAQLRCATYDEAVRQARGYGRAKAVDVFYTEDGGATYALIARFRRA